MRSRPDNRPRTRRRPRPRKFGLQGGVVGQYPVTHRIGSPDNSYTLGGTRFFENQDDDEDDWLELVPIVSKRALLVSFGRFGVSGGQHLSFLLVGRRDNERDLAFWGMGSEVFTNF
jgi:hypothetical protein